VIRCSGQLSINNFWASALEKLDFSRIAERASEWGVRAEAEIGLKGEIGWKWLAKLIPGLNLKVDGSGALTSTKEFAKAELSAQHLIPLLKRLPLQLVVEDFHYLDEAVKKELFQQWKSFVDEGPRASPRWRSNGRCTGPWSKSSTRVSWWASGAGRTIAC
jgi:hypothetical protein